ncbi:G-protein coupled receptor Mth2-like [Calliphora vicina]|uniref:G-protein coupled receptor Mth2-like n=1 Tax=Calliphora vicina TaxID=7373 RepID=UPI00325AC048
MFSDILCHLTLALILSFCTQTKSDFTKICPFVYTVDLTESPLLANGSYLYHNDTVIPPQFVRDYNYTILIDKNNKNSKNIRTHKRGCICAVKQCLPFCSDEMDKFYEKFKSPPVDQGFIKNVTFSGGLVLKKHLLHDFFPIYGNVCDIENGYMLSPEVEEHNEWTLYENSILLRHHDQRNLTLKEYCFDIEKRGDQFLINPIVCGETIDIPWFKIWAMAFSIPFLIITIICNCYFTQTIDARGKCFITYLSFVSLSYTLICCYTISGVDLSSIPCQLFGFTVYYTIIAYLTWTCILSYDTWKSVTDMNYNDPSFGYYSLVGFLIPLVMTMLTFLAHISTLPDQWKPGMAGDVCAVDTLRWSALIYYYIPCTVVFVYSLILYIWIVVFKKKHSAELKKLFGQGPEPLLERFALLFRIFLFMGISWSLDILSYFFRMAFGAQEYFIYIALDLFNAFHGFFVFVTFICKKSVMNKIKERLALRYNIKSNLLKNKDNIK